MLQRSTSDFRRGCILVFLRVLNCSFPRSAWERPSAPLCGAWGSVRPVCRAAEPPTIAFPRRAWNEGKGKYANDGRA